MPQMLLELTCDNFLLLLPLFSVHLYVTELSLTLVLKLYIFIASYLIYISVFYCLLYAFYFPYYFIGKLLEGWLFRCCFVCAFRINAWFTKKHFMIKGIKNSHDCKIIYYSSGYKGLKDFPRKETVSQGLFSGQMMKRSSFQVENQKPNTSYTWFPFYTQLFFFFFF